MALVLRHRAPRTILRGVTSTLTVDVRDEAGTAQTVSAGTLTISDGADVLVDAAAITPGTPPTYSLSATVTEARSTSDRLLEVWTVTVGSTSYVLTRPAYLVRWTFTPVLTPADLLDLYSDLDAILPPNGTWETKVTDARETIERELIKRGRRPDLVLDSWALYDALRHLVLANIFRDAKASIGDGRYAELATEHDAAYRDEWARVVFRYDTSETGTVTTSANTSPIAPTFLTAGRPRSQSFGRRL